MLARDDYDLSKFLFTGLVPVRRWSTSLSLSDLHIYLTVPFVLSWSLMNALACGCTVLASDTAPVAEMIADGENGLLADFFDVEGLARRAIEVLQGPAGVPGPGRPGLLDDRGAICPGRDASEARRSVRTGGLGGLSPRIAPPLSLDSGRPLPLSWGHP